MKRKERKKASKHSNQTSEKPFLVAPAIHTTNPHPSFVNPPTWLRSPHSARKVSVKACVMMLEDVWAL
jgi:hypothetical protein